MPSAVSDQIELPRAPDPNSKFTGGAGVRCEDVCGRKPIKPLSKSSAVVNGPGGERCRCASSLRGGEIGSSLLGVDPMDPMDPIDVFSLERGGVIGSMVVGFGAMGS